MIILKAALYAFLFLYLVWAFYLIYCPLFRAKREGTLTMPAFILGLPLFVIGLVIDVLGNLILNVIFWNWPQEWLMTYQLKRHINTAPAGSRNEKIASWICGNLLNPFDPRGKHC